MICNNCGRPCGDNEQFCPSCGKPLGSGFGTNDVAQAFVKAFNDPLFMVMCILVTVSILSFSVITLLVAIFMWMIFAKARSNMCDVNSMRSVSGTVYAMTILLWVSVGLLGFLAVITMVGGGAAASLGFFESIMDEAGLSGLGIAGAALAWAIGVGMLIAAAIIALINWFIYIPVHKFTKSLYLSAQNGVFAFERAGYTSTLMLVMGILSALGALGSIANIVSLIAGGCTAATWIVAYVWVRKYFIYPAQNLNGTQNFNNYNV